MIWNLLPIKVLWLAPAGVIIAGSVSLSALMDAGRGENSGGDSVLLGGLAGDDDLDAIFGPSDDELIFLEGLDEAGGETGAGVGPPRDSLDDEIDELLDDLTDDDIDDLLDGPPPEEPMEPPETTSVATARGDIAEACEGSPTPLERRADCAAAIFNSTVEQLGVDAVATATSDGDWWEAKLNGDRDGCERFWLVAGAPGMTEFVGANVTFELHGLFAEATMQSWTGEETEGWTCGAGAQFHGYWVQGPFRVSLYRVMNAQSQSASEEALASEVETIMEYVYAQLAPYDGLTSTP